MPLPLLSVNEPLTSQNFAQKCAEVCRGAQRGVKRCMEVCGGVLRDAWRCTEVHRGVQGGAQRCAEVVALATLDLVGDNREFEV